tara:strand:+ start:43 stop:189 length:147 start_codon:yes stop_codon:yes gene_type:complete
MYPAEIKPRNEFFCTLAKPINIPRKVAKISDEKIALRLLSHPIKIAHA